MKALHHHQRLLSSHARLRIGNQLQRFRHHAVHFGQWHQQRRLCGRSNPTVRLAARAGDLARLQCHESGAGIIQQQPVARRDNPGNAVKMTVPTVANGKVFVGAQYALSVFGNGISCPRPVSRPPAATFTNSMTVTLADADAGRGDLLYAGWHRADDQFHALHRRLRRDKHLEPPSRRRQIGSGQQRRGFRFVRQHRRRSGTAAD